MKILVTGHQGYIGSRMVPVLRAAGHDVVGLDCGFFEDCLLHPLDADVRTIRQDVRDVTETDLAGFDAVVHLAALSNDPLGDLKERWTVDINHEGSMHVARTARAAGVERFVFSSSCAMYGITPGDADLDERTPLNPMTAYARSKVSVEIALHELADDDFSPTYMRNGTCYGASPRVRADIVLNNLVAWACTTGRIKLLSDGSPWRPMVHVEDLSHAFRMVLEAPREVVHDQAFNIGAPGHNHQIIELAKVVAATVPACELEYPEKANELDERNYRVDFGKFARTFPAFDPQWNIEGGARELRDAYQAAGLTLEEFEGERLIRLNKLRGLIERRQLDDTLRWKEPAAIAEG